MSDVYPTPCVHSPDGRTLCPACQEEYDADPTAWEEWGNHPQGLKNWEALQAELADHFAANPPKTADDQDIPY